MQSFKKGEHLLHQSSTWYTCTKQNIAAKKGHNLEQAQDALPEQERQSFITQHPVAQKREIKKLKGVDKGEESF